MSERLDEALERLVMRGVLTRAQADAVTDEVGAPDVASPDVADDRGLPPGAELAAWLGAVLAAAAGVTAATRFWSELTVWAQAALLALVAVGLLVAGRMTLGDARPAARRLTGATWLLAIAAAGAAVAIPVGERASDSSIPWVVGAGVATALAVALWRAHEHGLQLAGVVFGVVATLLAALGLADAPPTDLFGLPVWAIGVALFLLAQGGLARPETTGRRLAAVLAAVGAQAVALPHERPGTLLVLATAAALFWLGGVLPDAVLLAVAAVALAVGVPQLIEAWFPGSLNAAATLFVSGVALLAGGLAAIRRRAGAAAPSDRKAGHAAD